MTHAERKEKNVFVKRQKNTSILRSLLEECVCFENACCTANRFTICLTLRLWCIALKSVNSVIKPLFSLIDMPDWHSNIDSTNGVRLGRGYLFVGQWQTGRVWNLNHILNSILTIPEETKDMEPRNIKKGIDRGSLQNSSIKLQI